jgi:ribosomal protein L11 methyltransferase
MAFRELVFTVPEDLAENLGDALMEMGALSISVSDAAADTDAEKPLYGEPGLTPERNAWEQSQVTALFDEVNLSIAEISTALSEEGFQINPPVERTVAEQDWVRLTQSQFDPIQVGQRLWVVPSWHEAPKDPNAVCLAVDPGLAFGTGSHPTTKLCMQWLEEQVDLSNQSLLDYGCGSGILAIAAKRLGCGPAIGVDIDPQAVISAKDNAIRNEVEVSFYLPEEDQPESQHNIVVANILANPLQVLAPALCQRIAPGGHIVLSGILERQAQEVIATYQPWLELHVWRECDGWVCLTGQLDTKAAQKKTLNKTSDTSPLWLKAFFAVFLSILIIIQICYLGRHVITHLIAKSPENIQESLTPFFSKIDETICSSISCRNMPIQDFSAWAIELANLEITPSHNSELQLQVRNKLKTYIAWPSIKLTLTDANDSVIAEKILAPTAWLPPEFITTTDHLKDGAPPNIEISSNIPLALPEQAAGFRVQLLYPN